MKRGLIKHVCFGIDGDLTQKEGEAIFDEARLAAKTIVEIKHYCGQSTVCMGLAIDNSDKKVFSIDDHAGGDRQPLFLAKRPKTDTKASFISSIEAYNLEEFVFPIFRKPYECSEIFKDGSIDLLYIGDRGYISNFSFWLYNKKVSKNGTIILTRNENEYGIKLIDLLKNSNQMFSHTKDVGKMSIFKKIDATNII